MTWGHGNLNKPFTTDIPSPVVQHLLHDRPYGTGAPHLCLRRSRRRHIQQSVSPCEPAGRCSGAFITSFQSSAPEDHQMFCPVLADWVVLVHRVCIPAKVVKTNGSAVISALNHRDQLVNLQGRNFTVPATGHTHNAISTHSTKHINSLDVKLTLVFADRGRCR